MSVDDYPDGDAGNEPVGTDLKTDLARAGQVVAAVVDDVDKAALDENVMELAEHMDDNNVPPEDAIAAAWFFILSHAD